MQGGITGWADEGFSFAPGGASEPVLDQPGTATQTCETVQKAQAGDDLM